MIFFLCFTARLKRRALTLVWWMDAVLRCRREWGASFVTENIKKIVGGWLCWFEKLDLSCLCALRVAARGPAAQGRIVILRLCGTAKAVP
jgi:hypothetical protein